MNFHKQVVWLILSSVLALCACAGEQQLRAVIVDERGKPIPGSLFYAEAWQHPGAFDFVFAAAGKDGEVPAAGSPALTIGWKWRANLSIAAFAPGRKPLVISDALGRVKADGIVLQLHELNEAEPEREARLTTLSFPFEEMPSLAARLREPRYAELRRAFHTAYQPPGVTEPPSGAMRQKLQALERLEGK
jgi:hypothetical protein